MSGPGVAPFGTELLDDPSADPFTVVRSLTNIARANRWFGGRSAALWGIERLLLGVPPERVVTLLDLGTGAGDLPMAAVAWAARRGRTIRPLGLERSPVAARLASGRGIPVVLACVGALPVRAEGVDIVLISQVAHHLSAPAATALFRAASAVARLGVVVADLRRSAVAMAAFRVGSAALGFDAVTRADGITSVRRGYHRDELAELVARAGQAGEVRRRPGFRLVATWRTH